MFRLPRFLHRLRTLRGRQQDGRRQVGVGPRSGEGETAGNAALGVGKFDDGKAIVRAESKEELMDLAAESLDGFAQFL